MKTMIRQTSVLCNLFHVIGEGEEGVNDFEDDWGALEDIFGEGVDTSNDDVNNKHTDDPANSEIEVPPEGSQPPASPVQEAKAPVATDDKETPPAVEPDKSVSQPTQAQEIETEEVPAARTPEQEAQVLGQLQEVLSKQYVLSEEQADLLVTDPNKVVPQLLAQMHMNVLSHALRMVQESLPQQFTQHTERALAEQKLNDQFSAAFPDLSLSDKEVNQAVTQAVALVKTQMPKATMEEKIQRVGALTRALLGKPAPTAQAVQQPVSRPAAPQPVSPSRTAPASRSSTAPAKDQWAGLIDEFTRED